MLQQQETVFWMQKSWIARTLKYQINGRVLIDRVLEKFRNLINGGSKQMGGGLEFEKSFKSLYKD